MHIDKLSKVLRRWRWTLHLYGSYFRRLSFAQMANYLYDKLYFSSRQRWPQLQQNICSFNDESLYELFSFEPAVQKALYNACREDRLENAYSLIEEQLQRENRPVFYFHASNREEYQLVASRLFPGQVQQAIDRASQIQRGHFEFDVGRPVTFAGAPRWDFDPWDKTEWSVRLNSFSSFTVLGQAYWYTGDASFAHTAVTLIRDWITRNSEGSLPAWKPMAVSQRILAWIWLYHLLQDSNVLDRETKGMLLKSLYQQGHFLRKHLEFGQANNHLLFNLTGLLTLGIQFPEFEGAQQWRRFAKRKLQQEIDRLFCSDGVYGEYSVHYHLVVSWQLLQTELMLRQQGQSLEHNSILQKMVEFLIQAVRPDGHLPLLADSYRGSHLCSPTDVIFLAGLMFGREDWLIRARSPSLRILWLWGPNWPAVEYDTAVPDLSSRAFTAGGYFFMRHKVKGDFYTVIDCGPFGHRRNPAHGHCDALAFELFAFGHPMLIDPGVFEYEKGKWRSFFRGTRAHNTVMIDGKEQSEIWGSMRVGRMAGATCHQWLSAPSFDFFDGAHEGYTRLRDPVIHRRQIVFLKGDYLIVCDHFNAKTTHRIDTFYHLPPTAQVSAHNGHTHLIAGFGDAHLAFFPLDDTPATMVTGQVDPPQGWVSYQNGRKYPAPVIHWQRDITGPWSSGAVLCPYRETGSIAQVKRVTSQADSLGAVVQHREGDDWFFSSFAAQPFELVGKLSGLAKFLWFRDNATDASPVILGADVAHFRFGDDFVLESSEPISWLDVRYEGDAITMAHGYDGPFSLTLCAQGATRVLVNGKPVEHARLGDTVRFKCD